MLIFIALALECLNLLFASGLLFHGDLDLLHTDRGFFLCNTEFLFLFISFSWKGIDLTLSFSKFFETRYQMLCLAATLTHDIWENSTVALYKVHELLWWDNKLGSSQIMQIYSTVDHLISTLTELLHHRTKLITCHLGQRFFRETFSPQDSALIEQRGVISTVLLEFGVLVICRVHNRQVLFDPWHKELEDSSTFELICHFIFDLGQQRLKFFRSVQPRNFTSRN